MKPKKMTAEKGRVSFLYLLLLPSFLPQRVMVPSFPQHPFIYIPQTNEDALFIQLALLLFLSSFLFIPCREGFPLPPFYLLRLFPFGRGLSSLYLLTASLPSLISLHFVLSAAPSGVAISRQNKWLNKLDTSSFDDPIQDAWCEAFSTYPRTYDLIHANGVFTLYRDKCKMEDILLEMDRILRPEGSVIFRDDVEVLIKVKKMVSGMRWDTKLVDHEEGPLVPEKILVAVKQYWVGGNKSKTVEQ